VVLVAAGVLSAGGGMSAAAAAVGGVGGVAGGWGVVGVGVAGVVVAARAGTSTIAQMVMAIFLSLLDFGLGRYLARYSSS
jgi:hypothetical protein